MGMNSGFGRAARGAMKPQQPGGLRQMFGGGGGGQPPQGGGFMGRALQAMRDKQNPQPTPQMTTGPQTGMRPPDQNGIRTAYDHRATAGPGGTQARMGGPPPQSAGNPMRRGGSMTSPGPQMQGRGNPMQRQMMQAQGMRGGMRGGGMKPQPPRGGMQPPNPGGGRMPMRGGRGMGGRGMRRY